MFEVTLKITDTKDSGRFCSVTETKGVFHMHVLSIGLNYRQTPVEIRECFALPEEELEEALLQLRHTKSILECVILSTCNRTEIYVVADQLHTGRHFTKKFMSEWFKVERGQFEDFLEIKENDEAIRHLFAVACGLDSMVLGETQILGQVRDAFLAAQKIGTTGTIFNELFKQVITLAKKAHSETEIGKNAVSVSYAAIELAKKLYGDLEGKTALIIGAGKMSQLTVKHLQANGVHDVMVINRTLAHAEELAEQCQGKAYDFATLPTCLTKADIVISSTGSRDYILGKEQVEAAMNKRSGRPIFFIDIAVPRDLDPEIHQVENAFLYDIDDLNGIVQANLAEREKEAEKIRQMIELALEDFKTWLKTLGVVPLITALRSKALAVQAATMQSIENKCPDLTERELKVIRQHTKSIVNQLLRDPILRIKELAVEKDREKALELFVNIFALEEELAKQEKEEQAAKSEQKQKESKVKYTERTSAQGLPI